MVFGLLCCSLYSLEFLTSWELMSLVKLLGAKMSLSSTCWAASAAALVGWLTALHLTSCQPLPQSGFLNAYRTSWARRAIPDVTPLWYSGTSLRTSAVSTWSWLSIRVNARWTSGRKPYLAGSSAVWRNEDANWRRLPEPDESVGAVVMLAPCTLGLWDEEGGNSQMRLQRY